MMEGWIRDINLSDFIEWIKEAPKPAEHFFDQHVLPIIEELEQDDYFGTEGFMKRFG